MPPTPKDPADRFWPKVQKTATCWLWVGAIDSSGYGNFGLPGGVTVKAHRWAYEDANGPIGEGLHLDHVKERCGHRNCVNPAHLEPVTLMENILRGDRSHLGRNQREKTRCPQGHPYNEENTYLTKKDRRRICKRCNRDRMRQRRAARHDDAVRGQQQQQTRDL